jgi:hypothetical protein
VSDGVLVRELPDGGREFVLEDPVLCALVIDGGITFRFGRTDVVVRRSSTLEVDGTEHRLDPGAPESLVPLLSCYPGTARWLWASPDGRLTVVLMQGQRLVVPGPPVPAAWSVGGKSGPGPAEGPRLPPPGP